jgi:cobalt/nickel transport system permease protein
MSKSGTTFLDLDYLDNIASGNTIIHRLDPRAKVLVTIIFIVTTVSFGKYDISPLLPLFLYPAVMVSLGELPFGYLGKKLLLLLPFAFFVGIFNPIFDSKIMLQAGPLMISGGWLSFISILIRFALTVGAALILIATTGFGEVCMALEKLGLPQVFAVQLLFLHRYIFVLGDEGLRMLRARELRSFGSHGKEMKVLGNIVGHLLLRTWERAKRIHMAMLCRGFRGDFHFRRPLGMGKTEVLFIFCWATFFILCRITNIPAFIGGIITEVFR